MIYSGRINSFMHCIHKLGFMLRAPNASKLNYVLTPYVDRGNDKWSRLFKVYWQNFTGLTGLWGLSGL